MSEISKYITIIRPEFMAFCKDACRAAALNHLLFRISGKCKDQPREKIQSGEILWYAKTELIASEMSDAWGVCKVRKEVNELVSMGLFGRKSNPTWGVDRTKHFCFGSEQCETLLKYCEDNEVCVVHLDLPAEVKHLIYSSLANDRTIKCTCEKADLAEANDKSITCIRYIHPMHSIDLSPAFDKSIEAITKTSTKTSNKDNSKEDTGDTLREENSTAQNVATATTPAPSSQSNSSNQPTEDRNERSHSNHLSGSATGVHDPNVSLGTQQTPLASQAKEQDSVATPELSTSLPPSGKVVRAVTQPPSQYQPPARDKGKGKTTKGSASNKVYFSMEGAAFRAWYEELTSVALDETAANARACNILGQRASVTYDNLKLVVKEIRTSKWVKRERVAVTVQDLASEDKMLRWEKWLLSAQQDTQPRQAAPEQKPSDNPYDYANILALSPLPTTGAPL